MKSKRSTLLTHRVHSVVNRRLTIWQIERRLWMFGALMGAATFNHTDSLVAGLFVFVAFYVSARCGTAWDPEFLKIMARAATCRARYDPAKWVRTSVVVKGSCDNSRPTS